MKKLNLNQRSGITYLYFAVGCLIFAYVLVRAILLDITFDESWTLRDFVPRTILNIFRYQPCDTNHHLLNTLLIKLFYAFLPHTAFVARIPNVLASILYIFFAYKICRKFCSEPIAFFSFIILLVNPFLLDFFSQARGYGLSLGFQMGSLYYLLSYVRDADPKDLIKMFSFSFFSVLSIFVMINFFIAEICVVFLLSILKPTQYKLKTNIIVASVFSILLALFIYTPVTKLIASNSLYYGGNTGFYHDSLVSLMQLSLYQQSVSSSVVYTVLNLFLIVVGVVVVLSFLHKQKWISPKNAAVLILLLCILAVIVQFYLLGTLYLLDRAALYFYPLFIIAFALSLNELRFVYVKNILVVLVCLAFCFNFFKNANFYKTALFYFEAHTRDLLELINLDGQDQQRVMKIDYSWPFESGVQYYVVEKKHYPYVESIQNRHHRSEVNLDFDYYIYLSESLERANYWAQYQKILEYRDSLILFKSYPHEGVLIFKQKE